MLLDDESQKLVMRAHFSDGEGLLPDNFSVPFGKGIAGAAAKARRPIYSPDVTTDRVISPRSPPPARNLPYL